MSGEFPSPEMVDAQNAAKTAEELTSLFSRAKQMLTARPQGLEKETALANMEADLGKLELQLIELQKLATVIATDQSTLNMNRWNKLTQSLRESFEYVIEFTTAAQRAERPITTKLVRNNDGSGW